MAVPRSRGGSSNDTTPVYLTVAWDSLLLEQAQRQLQNFVTTGRSQQQSLFPHQRRPLHRVRDAIPSLQCLNWCKLGISNSIHDKIANIWFRCCISFDMSCSACISWLCIDSLASDAVDGAIPPPEQPSKQDQDPPLVSASSEHTTEPIPPTPSEEEAADPNLAGFLDRLGGSIQGRRVNVTAPATERVRDYTEHIIFL